MEDTHALRLTSELVDLRAGYVHRHSVTPWAYGTEFKPKAYFSKGKKKWDESHFSLEVQAGFEPADNGVADRGLTTWLRHQILFLLERITGLEPATSTLARSRSTK